MPVKRAPSARISSLAGFFRRLRAGRRRPWADRDPDTGAKWSAQRTLQDQIPWADADNHRAMRTRPARSSTIPAALRAVSGSPSASQPRSAAVAGAIAKATGLTREISPSESAQ